MMTGRPLRRCDRWLEIAPSRTACRLRLICLPYAGGGASIYRSWPEDLPDSVEIWAVQPPGREGRFREQPFRSVQRLADVLAGLLAGEIDGPYALFGHSLGALIAYEVASRLSTLQISAMHLFVSGARAPHIRDERKSLHMASDDELLEELSRLKGTSPVILEDRELMDVLLPTLRADFEMADTYSSMSNGPLDVPITTFGGTLDDDVPIEALSAWREYSSSEFSLHSIEGDHFFINEQRKTLLDLLYPILASMSGRP